MSVSSIEQLPENIRFIPKARYVRLECDLLDEAGELRYPGFWFEARQNMTNGERIQLVQDIKEIDDAIQDVSDAAMDRAEDIDRRRNELTRRPDDAPPTWKTDAKAIRAIDAEMRAFLDEHRERLTALDRKKRDIVAPYIRAWNLYEYDEAAGTSIPVPSPAQGGAIVLEEIEPDLCSWMIVTCLTAYRLGKALGASKASGESQQPMSAPTSAAGPQIQAQPIRRSRKK